MIYQAKNKTLHIIVLRTNNMCVTPADVCTFSVVNTHPQANRLRLLSPVATIMHRRHG